MDVTREQLVDALDGFYLWIAPDRTQNVESTGVFGTVADPELIADTLIKQLSANAAHEPERTVSPHTLTVVHRPPTYYDGKGGMQPFDVIDAFGLDFYEGNVVKYLVRWRKKNGLEDLRKARTYLNRIIAQAEDADA